LTNGDVFPESIGGELSALFLCKTHQHRRAGARPSREKRTRWGAGFPVFRELVWRIDFPGVIIGGELSHYVIDLERGVERWCSKVPS
jgi:hypothetical protein